MWRAALQGHEDVAQGRRARRTDDADPLREARQRLLAFGGEQALGFQSCLHPGEGFEQAPEAGAAQGFDVELEVAACFVERDQRPGFDLLPVFQPPWKRLGLVAEHHATRLGAFILQREIDMTGCGTGQVGNFSRHPEQRELPFEALPRQPV